MSDRPQHGKFNIPIGDERQETISASAKSFDVVNEMWSGSILLKWDTNEISVPMNAHALTVPGYPSLFDSAVWPEQIVCDISELSNLEQYFMLIINNRTEWMARFRSSNKNDSSVAAFERLKCSMLKNSSAFKVDCFAKDYTTPIGTLYFWCTAEHGLIAVYRQNSLPFPAAFNKSSDLTSFMLSNNTDTPTINRDTKPGYESMGVIWTGFLQVHLCGPNQSFYISACQSHLSCEHGVLDTSMWPFNIWCSLPNMLHDSTLLESFTRNRNQWIVRFIPATSSDLHTQNALRNLALLMQARRIMFQVSCGTLNGEELVLCLFGVTHNRFGNILVGGFRIDIARPSQKTSAT